MRWKFLDGARTPAELLGRGIAVVAAEQYACRLVVPSSQRFGAKRWPSHKDDAAKALARLAGPHLPATLKQLEKAIAKAHADMHDAQEGTQQRGPIAADPLESTRDVSAAMRDLLTADLLNELSTRQLSQRPAWASLAQAIGVAGLHARRSTDARRDARTAPACSPTARSVRKSSANAWAAARTSA